MELTASRSPLLVALSVLVVFFLCGLSASDAQRIDTYLPEAGFETRESQGRGEFPRREELLQALNFLEEYERGKENDWDKNIDEEEDLLDDGENDINLGLDEMYPLGFDLDDEEPQDDLVPDYYEEEEEDNQVDIPDWLAEILLQDSQDDTPGEYLEEEPEALMNDEELLEMALEEEDALKEAQEAAYLDEIEREEEEVIADIVEEEKENEAVDNILDDLWAEDVLQKDAEKNLKWLLIEEEEKMRKEDAEEEMEMRKEELEEEEDPFFLGYVYDDEEVPMGDEYDYEEPSSFLQDLFEEYPLDDSDEDYDEETLDEDDEELLKEAEEMLDYQEPEEEDDGEAEMEATGALQRLIGSLTRQAVQEEMEAENYQDDLEDEDEENDEEEEVFPSSVLDAGMGIDEAMEGDEEDDELQREVYSELVELLGEEIDQAIDDVAEEILEELEKEKEEEEIEAEEEAVLEEADYNDMETGDRGDDRQGMMIDEEENTDADADDFCPALQYFIDDCNIVNNYGDLGGNGYKDLFTGACNRHQLCYACGEYFELGAKLCDELFKAELLAHCEADDVDCKQHAKYFWVVARSNRVAERESPPICADTCILTYLVET